MSGQLCHHGFGGVAGQLVLRHIVEGVSAPGHHDGVGEDFALYCAVA